MQKLKYLLIIYYERKYLRVSNKKHNQYSATLDGGVDNENGILYSRK